MIDTEEHHLDWRVKTMHTFLNVENFIVNLTNVVALEIQQNQQRQAVIRRIWYVGSTQPLELPDPGVPMAPLEQFLMQKGMLV